MARSDFEKLRVYRLAEQLSDEVWELARGWDLFSRNTIGKQIVRCSDGIGANIAEGAGRGSFKDNRRFVRIARGSLNETKHWLRRAYARNLLTAEQIARLRAILDNFAPQLNAYLKSIGRPCQP
jgi:four helix bundle protein